MVKPHLMFLFRNPFSWFLKTAEIFAISFSLVIGMFDPVAGAEFDVKSYIVPDSISIGDKFLIVNQVERKSGYRIEAIKPEDNSSEFAILSDISVNDRPEKEYVVFACTAAVYNIGETALPGFSYIATDSSGAIVNFKGDSLVVRVRSVLNERDTTAVDIADIKNPKRLRGPLWPYLLIPLIIGIIIGITYYLRIKLRKDINIPDIPGLPAWDLAFNKLDELKSKKHIEFGRIKQFYFELSLIVRIYIENRFDFPAAESTTYELENESRLKELEIDLYCNLFEFLNRSDLAKFAKSIPLPVQADNDINFSYDFIRKTIPVIKSAEEDKSEKMILEGS